MKYTSLLLSGLLVAAASIAYAADAPESECEAEVFSLWDEQVAWPSPEERQRPAGAVDVLVHRACEEYRFLHDNAVVWHGDTLFAAWYNCPSGEIVGSSSIRGRRSRDGGKTWSQVEVIASDHQGEGIFYVPIAFHSHRDTLYGYVTTMVGHDLVVNCEVYVLDEVTDQWKSRGVIADRFLPNCTPVLMEDGNYIMAGRVADKPKTKPEWPAVAISNGDNITEPWTVIRLMDDRLKVFPETSVWVDGKNITAISRCRPDQTPNGCSSPGRVFTSSDYGRTWCGPICHNLPELQDTKVYGGSLSSGQRYLVWTTPPAREGLVIAVSRPGEEQLAAVWQLQHGRSAELGVGPEWSYPYAVEHDGKLYVIYTSQKKHSVMTIIPVASLELGKKT
ncbi:MAG: exo-alpha-sialidase [Planctomycetaceae bacterium]|nr:MAG: exo-alpha-sialidase [Planctomycetaceae bacterium]